MTTAKRALHRVRARYMSYLVTIFKVLLLVELSFTILYPLFSQLATTFMTQSDLVDKTVEFFAKEPTLDNYRYLAEYTDYWVALRNSVILCVTVGLLTTLCAALCGYGFSKFSFKGRTLMFGIVLLSIIVPPQTILLSLYTKFRYFDIFGILRLCGVKSLPNLTNGGFLPVALLSVTGFGFRGGLFIFLMRQFYNGIPKELMEAAYVDGANVYRTYFSVIFPQGRTLMVTVFLLSFSWMWTDTFYANVLYSGYDIVARIVSSARYMSALGATQGTLTSGMYINTATMMLLAPLLLVFIFGQKLMVEGIENSGIVG